ncbi:7-cyano-7-deazaguanine synthase [Psychrobacter sp. Pi2-51]|uniref:7-cyano-7-deazaguanine synthase n=1 Tax=Psychrobacter sp. Pi2-51 TaxID=2774132 RepID=UPI001919444B|nr:7-cyano-7-deazaguanine synthase [Psychrobacter sp. Pi2-51]
MSSVILLSGGMDSICIAFWQRPSHAITIDYGQLAAQAEIESAIQICNELNISHHILTIDLGDLGSGDMAGKPINENAPASDWWPYRNQMLITIAAMKAITLNINQIIIGSVKTDSQHVDGTLGFIEKVNTLLSFQEGNIEVVAPAINMSTQELIRESKIPLSLLFWAHSCHKAEVSCGHCRGCSKYFETWQNILPS